MPFPHFALFSYCTFSCCFFHCALFPFLTFLCCTLFVLHFRHTALFPYNTLLMFRYFFHFSWFLYVLLFSLFSCCIHGSLFLCELFLCCIFFMLHFLLGAAFILHSFHVAFFRVATFLCCLIGLHSFHIALSSCCTAIY